MSKTGHRVAVCIDKSRVYGTGILQGIADYLELHGPWSVYLEPFSADALPWKRLGEWTGNGVLALLCTEQAARHVAKLSIPTVDVCGTLDYEILQEMGVPCVMSDHNEIGCMAAQHLIECGYPHFAYSGYRLLNWVERRWHGFRSRLSETGCAEDCPKDTCSLRRGFERRMTEKGCARHEYQLPPSQIGDPSRSIQRWETAQQDLMDWIAQLPKPVGIMACNDAHALDILDACHELELVVPDDVGIIGVDNDEAICRLSKPQLSSVIPDPRRIGFQAASALEKLMSGQRDGAAGLFVVSPIDVVARLSTQGTAVQDELIAKALKLIREKVSEGITAEHVLRETGLSRRAFYRRFQDQVGRTPHAEICRVRLAQVKRLLRDTKMSLEKVADLTGYCSSAHMSVAFKRELGIPPGEFRRRFHQLD